MKTTEGNILETISDVEVAVSKLLCIQFRNVLERKIIQFLIYSSFTTHSFTTSQLLQEHINVSVLLYLSAQKYLVDVLLCIPEGLLFSWRLCPDPALLQ